VRSAAAGLLHLVDGVLEIGRLEAGRVRVDIRRVPVAAFADELAHREWLAPHPGVTLRWDVRAADACIETDPAKLGIVLTNLVTNALKYTRAGEVVVTVRDGQGPGTSVDFEVADTGPGIPPAQLAHIREPFHETTGAASHSVGGVGLGLALVFRYAALLGAAVQVESSVGVGTTFVVVVPRTRVAASTAA
jgi:signal transduction histidine kinase